MDPHVPFRVRPRRRHVKTLRAFDVTTTIAAALDASTPSSEPPASGEPSSVGPAAPPTGAPHASPAVRTSLPPLRDGDGPAARGGFDIEGVVAGRFHLEERVDDGDGPQVWCAFDTFVAREVLLELGGDVDEEAIRASSSVASDDLVVPCASSAAGPEPFVAVPRLHGESLAERLAREGRLAPAECARVLATVSEGLAALHERGLVHGAIDAGAIFLVRSGDGGEAHAVLLAPGVPRLIAAGASSPAAVPPSLRAPEQLAHASDPDARTDLFALAAVLYQALTGRQPFVGRTPAELQQRVLTATFEPPSRLRRGLATPLDAFFRRAFAVDPTRRFGSARELGAVFRMVVDDDTRAGASTPPPGPRADGLRVRVLRAVRFAAVAAVLATVAVVAFWRLLQPAEPVEAADATIEAR